MANGGEIVLLALVAALLAYFIHIQAYLNDRKKHEKDEMWISSFIGYNRTRNKEYPGMNMQIDQYLRGTLPGR